MNDAPYPLALADGRSLHVHRWLPTGESRGSLLIVHGMAEHGGRYARLGQLLATRGYAVYAPDLPGHGRTAPAGELGWFGKPGWDGVLMAIHEMRCHIAAEAPGKPLFLMGHSMGSFLSQQYLVGHGRGLAGALLSATTGSMGFMRCVGIALITLESLYKGRRTPARVSDAMGFKKFNQTFAPTRTDFDWLSRDAEEVDRYIADPLCGFPCSAQLWLDLLHAGASLMDPMRLSRIPSGLPVRLIAGSVDPVSDGPKGPHLLAEAYRRAGLREVSVRIWPEGRHELLNDTCRDEVMSDITRWMTQHAR